MAFNVNVPKDDGHIANAPAEIRENFRALMEDSGLIEDIWEAAPGDAITYDSPNTFTTTTQGAFGVGDVLFVNGMLSLSVLSVGTTTPYLITVIGGTVPAEIFKMMKCRYKPAKAIDSLILNLQNEIRNLEDTRFTPAGAANDSVLLAGQPANHYDCSGGCSWTCGAGCTGSCNNSCTGTCMAGCTGGCSSCTGTCSGSCSSSCTGSCSGCSSCTATCTNQCSASQH